MTISISNIVNVNITVRTNVGNSVNFALSNIVGTSTRLQPYNRVSEFSTLEEVGKVFSATDPEYQAASAYLSQSPTPQSVLISRQFTVGAKGGVTFPNVDLTQVSVASLSGRLLLQGEGTASIVSATLPFSVAAGVSTLSALATTLNSQISAAASGVSVTVDQNNLIFTGASSTTSGSTSILRYRGYDSTLPSTTGTNIATQQLLGGSSVADPANYSFYGADPETPAQAMDAITNIRNDWYAFTYTNIDKGDSITQQANLDLCSWATAQGGTTNPHLFFFNTRDASTIINTATDIFSKNKAFSYKKATGVYDPSNLFPAIPAMAKIATINWSSPSSALTLAYKNAITLTPNSNLTQSQLNILFGKYGAAYVQYGTLFAGFSRSFKTGSGDYVDVIAAIDVLTVILQDAIADYLATTSKVPYTDSGAGLVAGIITSVLNGFVTNGVLAGGIWNGEEFGSLRKGSYVSEGYYVYVQRASNASQLDRNSRKYPPFRIALLGAGAIEQITINGTFQN